MEFARTDCPVCHKIVIVMADDPAMEWQYLCPGTPGRPCGKAFKFETRETQDDE